MNLVFNFRYFLVFFLSLISFGSGIIVFYYPGIQLPSTQDFQIFSSSHIFERFDLKYKNDFWFLRYDKFPVGEKKQNDLAQTQTLVQSSFVLPIRIIFGVLPTDNGDVLNPFDRGVLEFDSNFNMTSASSQAWLLEFCRDIRVQPFYRPTMGPMLTNCFIETFKSWMDNRKCSEIVGNEVVNKYPCCEMSKFPYEPHIFNYCLSEVIERLQKTPNYMFSMNRAGPRFNSSANGVVQAVVIEYDSVFDASNNSFEQMKSHWSQMNDWVNERLNSAPMEMKNGWFITSNMEFFALQQSLSTSVLKSLLISVLFAFLILIFTTCNIRLSLISTVTISCVIFNTIATLILLGWKLNIIESITVSLTIGLAIDATLHYTIAYKLLVQVSLHLIFFNLNFQINYL